MEVTYILKGGTEIYEEGEQEHQGSQKSLRNWNELKKGEEKSKWGDAMTTTKLGPLITWGVFGTQESKIKGRESEREDDGEDHHPITNTTGPGTPWGPLGTQKTE